MSLRIHFAALSLSASVDQQTGSLSIFDMVEEIRTPQLPVHLQSLVISLAVEKRDPAAFNGKMMIHILTPDGKQQMVGNGEIGVPAEQKRMKAVFRFGGFPVTMYGNHRFVLSLLTATNNKVAEAVLDFEAVQVTQVGQAPVPPTERGTTH